MPPSPDTHEPRRRRATWLRWLPLALLAGVSAVVLLSGAWHLLDFDRLMASRTWLRATVEADRSQAMALAALVYIACVVVSLPLSVVLSALCGFLFGPLSGAAIAVCSATIGATIVFSIGRVAAGDLIRRRSGPRLARFAEGFRRDAFGYVAFLRLLPLFPFWMTNLGPAAFGVRLRTFVLATVLGTIPGALVYATTGAGIEEAAAAHEAARSACLAAGNAACDGRLDIRSLVTPTMLAGLGARAGLALLSGVIRRRYERRVTQQTADRAER